MKLTFLFLLLTLILLFPLSLKAQSSSPERSGQIRADLNTIFAREEFRSEVARSNNPLVRAWKWVKEKWNAFWEGIRKLFSAAGIGIGASGLQWIFITVFLILSACLLARILKDYKGYKAEQVAGKRTAFEFDEADAETITDPDLWLQQAEQYAKAQDFRRAFRALFIATLLHMDRAGVIQFDRARTNGDYIRILRAGGRQEIARLFAPLVLEFDHRWYGERTTEEADFRTFRETYAALLSQLNPPIVTAPLTKSALEKA